MSSNGRLSTEPKIQQIIITDAMRTAGEEVIQAYGDWNIQDDPRGISPEKRNYDVKLSSFKDQLHEANPALNVRTAASEKERCQMKLLYRSVEPQVDALLKEIAGNRRCPKAFSSASPSRG